MKKVLLASTALVLSAGFAAADVSVGGDGRMGIIQDFDDVVTGESPDVAFTSRIRISFSASGETDGGLSFGGSIRADNASTVDGGGDVGTAGSVFVEGSFGKISMGDVSGAPEAAVGDLSGVGLTGLGDLNEALYLSNGNRPAMRWDYIMGDLGIHVSADNPSGEYDAYGAAVTYSTGALSMGLGFESSTLEAGSEILGIVLTDDLDADHIIGGVTYAFGDASIKAIYGTADIEDVDADQYGVSLDYVMGATTLTAFYYKAELSDDLADAEAYGIGAAYDLGGGASLKGGWVNVEANADGASYDSDSFDFGLSMSF